MSIAPQHLEVSALPACWVSSVNSDRSAAAEPQPHVVLPKPQPDVRPTLFIKYQLKLTHLMPNPRTAGGRHQVVYADGKGVEGERAQSQSGCKARALNFTFAGRRHEAADEGGQGAAVARADT